jgi:hypothetical protein
MSPTEPPAPTEWPAAPYRSDAELRRLGEGLLEATLPKSAWTHAGHLGATFWLLTRRPEIELDTALPGLIRRLNDSHGVPNNDERGYHETITRAYLGALRHAAATAPPGTPGHEVVNAMLAGPFGGGKASLLSHWSEASLFSREARHGWVPPDRKPLPFPVG